MVVVPTDTDVTLTYGRTPVDIVAILLSLLGVAGLVFLARRPRVEVRELRAADGTPPTRPEVGPDPWSEDVGDHERESSSPTVDA